MSALKTAKTAVQLAVLPAVLLMSGCAATEMAIQHHNLQTQTKMSNSIFLTPVSPTLQTVYLQIRNTSDKTLDTAAITQELTADLENQGYRVVAFTHAHYLMQVNVLSVGKTTMSAAQSALGGGYGGAMMGSPLGGILGGALAGGVISQSFVGAGAGGLAGGAVSFLADSMVHTNTYDMVTDVQLGVRHKHTVVTHTAGNLQQGTSTTTHQDTTVSGHWVDYRTRIVSVADQVDLSFKKALPVLQGQLVHSLGGIL